MAIRTIYKSIELFRLFSKPISRMSNPQQYLINPNTPPTSAYTTQQNINNGFYNSKGQFIFNPNLDISNSYVSPASIPSYPLQPGSNASQIHVNQNDKAIFTALNLQQQQVLATQQGTATGINRRTLNGPIFTSYRELNSYIKAQYTQGIPVYSPKPYLNTQPPYSVNTTLFNLGFQ